MIDLHRLGREPYKYILTKAKFINSSRYARNLLRSVTRQPYAYSISSADRKRIREYSRYTFGSSISHWWLQFYTAVNGTFHEGWIPDDFYGVVALPIVNAPYRTMSNAKTLSRRILATDRIPDLAYFTNGVWFDVAGELISRDRVRDVLASQAPAVIVKLENSNQGRGVFRLSGSDLVPSSLESLGSLVVQKYIQQHQLLEGLSPGCLATLRITTGLTPEGTIECLGSYLRMGHLGAQVIRSSEALKAVVAEDGCLDQFAYAPDYARHPAHPDTGVPFAGLAVPGFASAMSLCLSLHRKVPQFTIVGWDIGIAANGDVQVIEWNTDFPDIKFVEAVAGPHLRLLRLERLARQEQGAGR